MKKKIISVSIFLCVVFSAVLIYPANAMDFYEEVDADTGVVKVNALNVRKGPGLSYDVIETVDEGEVVRIFAKIGNWYVVQTELNYIGAASADYIDLSYPEEVVANENNVQNVVDLVNAERKQYGLKELVIDEELQKVAELKAKDLVENNYFDHVSPTYGSPFDMLAKYGIEYKIAGENLAGNSSNTGAVQAWMDSEGHRENILNNAYNYTGVAVVDSPTYGKVYVQLFKGE